MILSGTLLLLFSLGGADGARSADDVLGRIRNEGLRRSQALSLFRTLTDDFGPRLTGSPSYNKAAAWARDTFKEWGLVDARLEGWTFGRGWTLERFSLELVRPWYAPLIGFPEAWSTATDGSIEGTPVVVDPTSTALLRETSSLAGKILLWERRPSPRTPRPLARALTAAAAILIPGSGDGGTIFVDGDDLGDDAPPRVILSPEHHRLLLTLMQRGIPVSVRVEVAAAFDDKDGQGYNVIADLPATEAASSQEVVMVGAHLDSWHAAVGATDNADGVAAVMEAIRILRSVNPPMRRTVRVALWGGEEQSGLGSLDHVRRHLEGDHNRAAREGVSVYFNNDAGTGPVRGFYLAGQEAVRPTFDLWLEPLSDLGATGNLSGAGGGSDHSSFQRIGIPAFNVVQDSPDYVTRTRHTNMDFADRVLEKDLQQAAIVLASFVYRAASADFRLPRRAP